MGSPETVELAGALSEMAARVASARVAAAHWDGTSVVGTGVTVDGEHGSWEEPIAELVWIRECRAALRLIELEAIRRLRVDRAVRVPWQEIGEALGTTKQAAHHRLRSEVITPGATLADLVPPGQGLPGVDEYLARHPPLPAPAPLRVRDRPIRPRNAALFDRVRQLSTDGHTINEICALTGLSRATVHRYITARPLGPGTGNSAT